MPKTYLRNNVLHTMTEEEDAAFDEMQARLSAEAEAAAERELRVEHTKRIINALVDSDTEYLAAMEARRVK